MFVAKSSQIFSLHLKCCNVIKYKNMYCKANILNVPHINNIKDVIGKKCVLPMHNYIVNIFINADVSYDNHLCCRKYYLKKTHVFL
jgi:hypothetical protein